jgi:hypothetical protein
MRPTDIGSVKARRASHAEQGGSDQAVPRHRLRWWADGTQHAGRREAAADAGKSRGERHRSGWTSRLREGRHDRSGGRDDGGDAGVARLVSTGTRRSGRPDGCVVRHPSSRRTNPHDATPAGVVRHRRAVERGQRRSADLGWSHDPASWLSGLTNPTASAGGLRRRGWVSWLVRASKPGPDPYAFGRGEESSTRGLPSRAPDEVGCAGGAGKGERARRRPGRAVRLLRE